MIKKHLFAFIYALMLTAFSIYRFIATTTKSTAKRIR